MTAELARDIEARWRNREVVKLKARHECVSTNMKVCNQNFG